jgi:xanthosine utilization system XapX-like protein
LPNIALIGLFLFLMGQAIYHFAMRVNSGEVVPWRRPLKPLSTFGIALGSAAVLLGLLSDVLNPE